MRIVDMAPRIASGEQSIVSLLESCLAGVRRDNDWLHAVSTLFADAALEKARCLEQERIEQGVRGPLHGIPLLLKELIDIAGWPTSFGSLAYSDQAASHNAAVVDRLEAAGAIILGTTHMVEFAFGSWGTNYAKGTPWNPRDRLRHRVPGGSSSGSAVAVAAGLVPAAIGSDTGGSVRIPASLCGVVGFKPSFGLISNQGVAPLGPTFDTLGPLCTCVADARILTAIMSGQSLEGQKIDLAGLTIAVVPESALLPIDPQVLEQYRLALDGLRKHGVIVETIPLPRSFVDYQKLNGGIVSYEAFQHLAAIVEDPARPIDPYVRQRVLQGKTIDETRYEELKHECLAEAQRFSESFRGVSALLLPGTPLMAIPLDEVNEAVIPMSRYTRVANCLNLCAISIPVPRAATSLPIGLQLCAPDGMDAQLLSLAEAVVDLLAEEASGGQGGR